MFSLPNHLEIVFVHGGGNFAAISALKAALRAGEDARPYEMGESSDYAVGADDLGGTLRGLCDSRAHPHPPRMRSAPSPL